MGLTERVPEPKVETRSEKKSGGVLGTQHLHFGVLGHSRSTLGNVVAVGELWFQVLPPCLEGPADHGERPDFVPTPHIYFGRCMFHMVHGHQASLEGDYIGACRIFINRLLGVISEISDRSLDGDFTAFWCGGLRVPLCCQFLGVQVPK